MLADDADQVNDGVTAGHALLEPLEAEDVALDARDGPLPAQRPFRAPPHEAADDVAGRAEPLEQGMPHEPRRARHEHLPDRLHMTD